jgi:hypothetical protein
VERNSKVRAAEAVQLPKVSPKWPIMPCGQTGGRNKVVATAVSTFDLGRQSMPIDQSFLTVRHRRHRSATHVPGSI